MVNRIRVRRGKKKTWTKRRQGGEKNRGGKRRVSKELGEEDGVGEGGKKGN